MCTINKTATRSPLSNRGYDRREHPRRVCSSDIDPEGVAQHTDGAPFQGASILHALPPQVVPTYGSLKGQSDKVERLSGDGSPSWWYTYG